MIRGFYSAASGMKSQQLKLNTVANNFANVSTVGFKTQEAQFSELIYANVNGALPPISTGHGVRVIDNATDYTQGQYVFTGLPTDFAISGDAFFAVENDLTGEILYTRAGNFQYQVSEEDEGRYLITNQGAYVLDAEGERINIDERMADLEEDEVFSLASVIGLYQFPNNFGLEHAGSNLYRATEVSGEAEALELEEMDFDDYEEGQAPQVPHLIQNYLEYSNVNVAEQMVKMLEASRAFSFNSRVVSVTDQLEQEVNQLR